MIWMSIQTKGAREREREGGENERNNQGKTIQKGDVPDRKKTEIE